MAPKKLLALRLMIDHPQGLFGSQFVHLSNGKLNRGTVYTLLERLVEEGFVKEVPVPASSDLQLARTRHEITAMGKRAYKAFLQEQGLTTVPFATASA
jgi:DNA-binding PadR family transcriptional regulator